MTIQDCIEQINIFCPNTIADPIKIQWLAMADGMMRQQIVAKHLPQNTAAQDMAPPVQALTGMNQFARELLATKGFVLHPLGTGADVDPSPAATLLIPPPYHQLYMYWLGAQIAFTLGEIDHYNNNMKEYNETVDTFAALYKAQNRPVPRGQFVL